MQSGEYNSAISQTALRNKATSDSKFTANENPSSNLRHIKSETIDTQMVSLSWE